MGSESILIVEDADLVRNTLRTRLEEEGFKVTAAGTVREALEAIRGWMPDLIILDLTVFDEEDPLSGICDGFVFLGLLRLNYPDANPAVIIYTVNNSPLVESRAKSMGAFAVIEKTSGFQTLLNAIRQGLEQRNVGEVGSTLPSAA